MNVRQKVQECIQRCQNSAADLRSAAAETENHQAKNVFQQSAQKIEECVKDCQIALNQLVK